MSKQSHAFTLFEAGQKPAWKPLDLSRPGPGEISVRIRACALNFADLLMIKGTYQDTPAPPFVLGLELAGDITACGEGVEFAPGDRVAIYAGQGGLATHGTFQAARATRLPDGVDYDTGAALQIAYGTSHMALDYKAHLKPGERLVVTGAAGGVGLTAFEIGKIMGAEVIAIARGADKLAVAKAAGADHLIDADASDIRDRIKALGGADVVYDAVGGPLYDPCFRATNPDGRYRLIGFAGGVPEIKPNHMLVKNITAIGIYWGAYYKFNPAPLLASLETLMRWADEGRITPHLSHRLPPDQIEKGLDLLRTREATGKVVITF